MEKEHNLAVEKLDKIAALIEKMIDPMAYTLKEIKASNRSRWIVLLFMAGMLGITTLLSYYMLDRMSTLVDQMAATQGTLVIQMSQVKQIAELMEQTAKTPAQKAQIQEIINLSAPTTSNFIKAAVQLAPTLIVKENKE